MTGRNTNRETVSYSERERNNSHNDTIEKKAYLKVTFSETFFK